MSLLPKYRGPSPFFWIIAKGETVSGVTAHFMTEKIDGGDIIAQSKFPILGYTYSELVRKSIEETPRLIKQVYRFFSEGNKEPVKQDDAEKLKEFLSPYYHIPSPASGKVMARNLTLGERVENNTSIFEISDTRKLWVLLDAMEKDLRYIEKNKKLTIVSDIYPEEHFAGRVLTLMEKIDPKLRTVKVRAEVEEDPNVAYLLAFLEKSERGFCR